MFSCEFCELFKNTYFEKDLRMAGSETPVLGTLFNKVASFTAWTHLTVLETEAATGGVYHFSHDVLFFLFVDQRGVQSKISSILCSYGNQVETPTSSCGHTCTDIGTRSGRKSTEKFVKVGSILLLCNSRSRDFHISKIRNS